MILAQWQWLIILTIHLSYNLYLHGQYRLLAMLLLRHNHKIHILRILKTHQPIIIQMLWLYKEQWIFSITIQNKLIVLIWHLMILAAWILMAGLFKLVMNFQCQWVMIQAKAASHGKDGLKLSLHKIVKIAMEWHQNMIGH